MSKSKIKPTTAPSLVKRSCRKATGIGSMAGSYKATGTTFNGFLICHVAQSKEAANAGVDGQFTLINSYDAHLKAVHNLKRREFRRKQKQNTTQK